MAMETDRQVDKYGYRRQTDRWTKIDTSYRDADWQIWIQSKETQTGKYGYKLKILTDKYGYKLQRPGLTNMDTSFRDPD